MPRFLRLKGLAQAPSARAVYRLTFACLLGFTIALPAAERPNFLFLYTDDQRHDALGVVQREQGERGRFPWFQTPHLDGLATNGVRFRNAFVVNALCAPSRAVFLTGRYNHLNGIASNFRAFPTNNVTHATLLRASGYTTAYIGKWHMDSQRERPGFDYHASFIGHARYRDPVFIVQGKDVETHGWIDDISTDYAIEFLRGQRAGTKPWSLVVGFKSPHGPFEPPDRATNRFPGAMARSVPNLVTPTAYLGRAARRAAPPGAQGPVNLNYFRCISAVDDCVGRLLAALDEFELAGNTVVVYTSDNGFYLGEHGLADKRSAYEESLRIPFLVRSPASGATARGRVVDEMVLNLDLAPTLLELAGVAVPPEMQGRSWRSLLEGRRTPWREAWFYEYFAEKQPGSRVPDITAVRTASAKLIKYPGHEEWTELFDLSADPFEMENLYRDPRRAPLRRELEGAHDQLTREVGYRVPDYVDRPDWWGKPEGPDHETNATPELRLEFTFLKDIAHRVTDTSGKANHGMNRGSSAAAGRAGAGARAFDGDSFIEVGKAPSLNPSRGPWTVEAVIQPAKPDGVVLARGGKSQGYSLWIKDRKPAFTVAADGKPTTVQGEQPITGWTVLTGVITPEWQAELYVDGRKVAGAPLGGFIGGDPGDTMQIGADTGSPVVQPPPPNYRGLIERVSLWRGARPPGSK